MGVKKRPIPHDIPVLNRLRTRSIRPHNPDGSSDWRPWETYDATQALRHLNGRQVTVSESHPSWKDRDKRPFKDIGGPFFTQTRKCESINAWTDMRGGTREDQYGGREIAHYQGYLLPCSPHLMEWPDDIAFSNEDTLSELGATAIARCSPSNPVADVTTLLGELVKDGIPSMIGQTLKGWKGQSNRERRKAIGKEYLNYEFGWKPLTNDLRKLSEAITRGDALWAQYERDAGKLVRRRYEFPKIEETKSHDMGLLGPSYVPSTSTLSNVDSYELNGMVTRVDRISRRRWFSGAFTYYLPKEDRETVAYNVIQAKKLLGLRLTPDAVWNLMPWSWALDWFGNTGDVLQNWSNWAIDGQVLWYGYMMEHSIVERTYAYYGDTRLRGSPVPGVVKLSIETKQRIKAGPYGFGSQFDGLTPRQIAITTALGLTKS